jgi:hypothetical protein
MEQTKTFAKPSSSNVCKDVQASNHPLDQLYGATPGCDGIIYSNFYGGGGVKCTKCAAWFCF